MTTKGICAVCQRVFDELYLGTASEPQFTEALPDRDTYIQRAKDECARLGIVPYLRTITRQYGHRRDFHYARLIK